MNDSTDSSEPELMQGIEKQFKEALQALAVSPEDQVKFTEPGDVPEEIIDDYLLWANSYKNHFNAKLDANIVHEITELEKLVDTLPETVFRDTNIDSMKQPEWQPLRVKAKLLLKKLNWPDEPPPPFIQHGKGMYRRN